MVSFVNTEFTGFAKWAPPWAHGLVASTLIKKAFDLELAVRFVVEFPNKPREAALIIPCCPDCGVGKAKDVNIKWALMKMVAGECRLTPNIQMTRTDSSVVRFFYLGRVRPHNAI